MAHGFTTALCTRLQLRVPVVLAPMQRVVTPELAASVSAAGGLGLLPASRTSTAELSSSIQQIRQRTAASFGISFLIGPPETATPVSDELRFALDHCRGLLGLDHAAPLLPTPPASTGELVETALAAGVRIFSFSMGNPAPLVDRLHRDGALVIAAATTVDESRRLESAGVDFIVAQGAEAGGARMGFDTEPWMDPPMVGTMALVPQVADAVRVPVIAAGGIMDGRGIAAALALGAAGAQLGTRFLLASEAAVFRAYRERLLTALETDTVLTRAFDGRLARSLSNRFVEHLAMQGASPLPWPHQACLADDIFRAAAAQDNADWAPLYAGQGMGLAQQVEPAAQIVAQLAQELQRVMASLRGHETARAS